MAGLAGFFSLGLMQNTSDAGILNVGVSSGNSNIYDENMWINYNLSGKEGADLGDIYWNRRDFNAPEGVNKIARPYSNQINILRKTKGLELFEDEREVGSPGSFPIRFDSVARDSASEGIFDSSGNHIWFDIEKNWDSAYLDSIKDYAYELKVWGNGSESDPYFTESTASTGYGVRSLINNNSGRTLGSFDLSGIEALTDGSTDSVGGPDWGSLTLTPSENIIPEPTTGLAFGLTALLGGLSIGSRRSYSKKKGESKILMQFQYSQPGKTDI